MKSEHNIDLIRKKLDALESKLFSDATPSASPTLVFTWATPGSGKTTTLIPKISKQFEQPFILEIDDIKYFIPLSLPDITRKKLKDEYYWKFINRAVDEKRTIITTFPYLVFDLKSLRKLLEKARGKGYEIDNLFMNVSFSQAYKGSIKKQTDTNPLLDKQFRFRPDIFTMAAFHLRNKYAKNVMKKNPDTFGKVSVYDRDVNLVSR